MFLVFLVVSNVQYGLRTTAMSSTRTTALPPLCLQFTNSHGSFCCCCGAVENVFLTGCVEGLMPEKWRMFLAQHLTCQIASHGTKQPFHITECDSERHTPMHRSCTG